MIPTVASIFLDYRCNYACAHCSVGSSPDTIFPMPEDLLTQIITEELPRLPGLNVVVFTGGEPTMRRRELLRGLSLAKEQGYITRLVTNGWWGRSASKAAAWLDELVAAGLDELSTSYDDYHGQYGSIEPVLNCIGAAVERGMRVAVASIVAPGGTWGKEAVTAAIADHIGKPVDLLETLVYVIEDLPTPSGSGKSIDVSTIAVATREQMELGCRDVMATLTFHPDATVKACCGHAMFQTPDLTIGSLREEHIDEIIERAQSSAVYWLIHSIGPKRILEDLGVDGTYTSICHACDVLFTQHRREFFDYVRRNKSEAVLNSALLSDHLKRSANVMIRRRNSLDQRLAQAQ